MAMNTETVIAGGRALVQDVVDLVLIAWALPLVILALVLPMAGLDAVVRAVLHSR